jgi:hypothetical protein
VLWSAAVRAIQFPGFQFLEYSLGMARSLTAARTIRFLGLIRFQAQNAGMSEGGSLWGKPKWSSRSSRNSFEWRNHLYRSISMGSGMAYTLSWS